MNILKFNFKFWNSSPKIQIRFWIFWTKSFVAASPASTFHVGESTSQTPRQTREFNYSSFYWFYHFCQSHSQEKRNEAEAARMADDCSLETLHHPSHPLKRQKATICGGVLAFPNSISDLFAQFKNNPNQLVTSFTKGWFGRVYAGDRVMLVQSESIHYSGWLPNLPWVQWCIKLANSNAVGVDTFLPTIFPGYKI